MMELPIEAIIPELRRRLTEGRNVVLQAPPGAGKTTRVPLALLAEPWLEGRRIVVLEPRRLAARAAAFFMAETRGEKIGRTIGYRTRLDSRIGPQTRVEVVTEGVLTRLLQTDPALADYGLVVFDEFHERNLHADLGLALCLEAQGALREDLRLLVMSATLDGAPVAALLGRAPILSAEGRSYPVQTRYPERQPAGRIEDAVAAAVKNALAADPGDVLVFLPGEREIRRVENLLREVDHAPQVVITPLYGNLPREAQDRAIRPAPAGTRKVVLATSIAETSLTIEGIGVVIDAGLRRTPRFDPRSGLSRLETVKVSKAAAEQRRGRAGRLGPGVCYRLWTEAEHRRLPEHGTPEILETDLAPLALELARWGVNDPACLAWLDPPPQAALAQARDLLRRLDALDRQGRITTHGRRMAELPLHPRLAHMVLAAEALELGGLACELAALLSERDLLAGTRPQADLRLRLAALHTRHDSSAERVRRAVQQLRRRLKIPPGRPDADKAGLLLAFAYPDRIARRRPGGDGRYRLAGGRGAYFPEPEPLAFEDYLAIAELDGDPREARIFLAAPLALSELEEHFAQAIERIDQVVWNDGEKAVLARRQRRLGELVLKDEPLPDPDPEKLTAALIQGIRREGVGCLPWTRELHTWRARVLCLRRLEGTEQWPDVSDEALLAGLETWLGPWLQGLSRLSHLAQLNLREALLGLLDWRQRRALDELAPTHLTVPSGSRIALDYAAETPVLAVRLQELFGLAATPRIARGRVAVILHLLSPARRPVQVTQDLESFWATTYPEVRKELKGRYPKHDWPDNPLQAEPTRRVKARV